MVTGPSNFGARCRRFTAASTRSGGSIAPGGNVSRTRRSSKVKSRRRALSGMPFGTPASHSSGARRGQPMAFRAKPETLPMCRFAVNYENLEASVRSACSRGMRARRRTSLQAGLSEAAGWSGAMGIVARTAGRDLHGRASEGHPGWDGGGRQRRWRWSFDDDCTQDHRNAGRRRAHCFQPDEAGQKPACRRAWRPMLNAVTWTRSVRS